MTWRTVVISSGAKLDLKLGAMVVRSALNTRKVHLSEVSVLIIESTAVSISAMLLCELNRRKIKVIFCDERHNPYGELIPCHGSHDSAAKLREQIGWSQEAKDNVWREIVREKIIRQANLLEHYDFERAQMLRRYADEVEPGDDTNREGHAAKVYFNTLFGDEFSRKSDSFTNARLNYGYAILSSIVNREITALGYKTELGIFHDNTFNHFNFGSDLMEPLRPLIDSLVLDMPDGDLTSEDKHTIAKVINHIVEIDGKRQYLVNAVRIYVKSVADALTENNLELLRFCNYERSGYEADSVLRSSGAD